MLIDTHCHFNHTRLASEVAPCIERAKLLGIEKMIVVGYNMESSLEAVRLAEAYPEVLYAAVGIHPHDAKSWQPEFETTILRLCENSAVVAVGEIGLDFHYNFSTPEAQYFAFKAQLALAKQVRLPVIIHCREAYPETLSVLEEANIQENGGVMHCWAGAVQEAQKTVALGMALGFGGTLTFKNAEEVRSAAALVPETALLVETDAPYLAPMPFRGKRNEPAYTRYVAERLAQVRSLTFEQIAQITTKNALDTFPRLNSK